MCLHPRFSIPEPGVVSGLASEENNLLAGLVVGHRCATARGRVDGGEYLSPPGPGADPRRPGRVSTYQAVCTQRDEYRSQHQGECQQGRRTEHPPRLEPRSRVVLSPRGAEDVPRQIN